jgi:polyhydroxyalkanoate synthesis repressor PhaR
MPDPVVLKKYSNRRLYDTHQSRYVTLEDVAIMIRNGKPVQIVDASTGEDVTAFILTQIVLSVHPEIGKLGRDQGFENFYPQAYS